MNAIPFASKFLNLIEKRKYFASFPASVSSPKNMFLLAKDWLGDLAQREGLSLLLLRREAWGGSRFAL